MNDDLITTVRMLWAFTGAISLGLYFHSVLIGLAIISILFAIDK